MGDGKRGSGRVHRVAEREGHLVAYVGDVVGTGSSRKSATNSVLWFTGQDILSIRTSASGGDCLGGKIAPIFYNTMEDAGALPIELDVAQMNMGDVIELRPYEGQGAEERAGDRRVPGQVRRAVRRGARRRPHPADRRPRPDREAGRARRLACRRRRCSACRRTRPTPARATRWRRRWSAARGWREGKGIRPGTYCEPKMILVGLQDTTGPDDARRVEGPGLPPAFRPTS